MSSYSLLIYSKTNTSTVELMLPASFYRKIPGKIRINGRWITAQVTPGKVNEVCEANYMGHFIPENFIEKMLKATKQYPVLPPE